MRKAVAEQDLQRQSDLLADSLCSTKGPTTRLFGLSGCLSLLFPYEIKRGQARHIRSLFPLGFRPAGAIA